MNTNTGELRRISESLSKEEREAFFREFTEVPDELAAEAEEELSGKESTVVDMKKNTPLVNWAKAQRIAKELAKARRRIWEKKKVKRKQGKASRRRNRK